MTEAVGEKLMSLSAPLDVAVIGAGQMGRRHTAAIRASGDRIAAVVDTDADRRTAFSDEFGTVAMNEVARLPDVTVAVVCTPSMDHLPTTIELVRRGVAVLVEKPHRCPGQDAAELIDTLAECDAFVSVGMTTRYQPGIRAVIDAVTGGAIGAVQFVSDRIWFHIAEGELAPWYFDPTLAGGGVALTNGVHSLERMSALLGGPLELIAATTAPIRPGSTVEELATINIRGPHGKLGVVSLLWADFDVEDTELLVVGTGGTARVDAAGCWTIHSRDGTARGRPSTSDDYVRDQWVAFREALLGRAPPPFGIDGLEPAIALIERIYGRDRHAG